MVSRMGHVGLEGIHVSSPGAVTVRIKGKERGEVVDGWESNVIIRRATVKTTMIIPAKGFSLRIPRKNLKPFCGLPLVAWGAIQGKYSKLVDEVLITTDSPEIEAVVKPYGARVMYRGYQDTDETNGTVPVTEAVERLRDNGEVADDDLFIVHLGPFVVLKPQDFDRLVMAFLSYRDSSPVEIGAGTFRAVYRTLGAIRIIGPGETAGRQFHCINDYSIAATHGCCTSVAWAKDYGVKTGKQSRYVAIEPWQDHDVDTLPEWEYAELAMEHYILKGRGEAAYKEYRYGT